MNTQPKRLLSYDYAADQSDTSRSTIRRAAAAGKLVVVKVGALSLVTAESFNAWVSGLPRAEFRQPKAAT